MHPQGCQILSLDPLLFGLNHMPVNWCIRQDSHLQTLRSKRRMIIISPRMRKAPREKTEDCAEESYFELSLCLQRWRLAKT